MHPGRFDLINADLQVLADEVIIARADIEFAVVAIALRYHFPGGVNEKFSLREPVDARGRMLRNGDLLARFYHQPISAQARVRPFGIPGGLGEGEQRSVEAADAR